MTREEAEYLIAKHIDENGLTLCKAGVAAGGGSEQFRVDPSKMVQIDKDDEPNPGYKVTTDQRRRAALRVIEKNSLRGFKPGITIPPKPEPKPVVQQIILQSPRPKPVRDVSPEVASPRAAPSPRPRVIKTAKPTMLARDHEAAMYGFTVHQPLVRAAAGEFQLLKSAAGDRKIGSHVLVGDWASMPIFTLTLEERATCPRSCLHWRDCTGNAMTKAARIADDGTLMPKLERELAALNMMYAEGFVVRLHILGDFYSVDYARFWQRMLATLKGLRIFGYTARTPSDEIGAVIDAMNRESGGNCVIRFSNGVAYIPRTVTIDRPEQAGSAIICPAQTEKTACCGSCGLCWSSEKPIAFLRH